MAVALLACACAAPEEAPPPVNGRPVVEEIPVTTESEAARAAFEAGRDRLDVGRATEANELFRMAVEEDPGFAFAHLNIANSAASAVEFKTHLDLAAAHLDGKSDGERLLIAILRTFLDNDAEERMRLSRELVETYPSSPRAWLTLGAMQATLNRHPAARESYARALELRPEMVAAHLALGVSYLFNEPKDFQRAREEMEMSIQLAPEEAKTYEALGDVQRAMNELEAAGNSYGLALETDPSLSVAALKKGHIDSFLGNHDAARADFDEAIAGASGVNRPIYANYRAFTRIHEGDPGSALAELTDLEAAIDKMGLPEDQARGARLFTLTNAAAVAIHYGEVEVAERILERRDEVVRANAAAVGDEDFSRRQEADIELWRGRLAVAAGDLEAARARAERNRELLQGDSNPRRLEGYHELLGRIALAAGDAAEAVAQFERADLTVTYVRFHLARALEAAGETERARELFREVARWNFNSVGYAMIRKEATERGS
jgi:tetratricopeptide (TPR) repeat protein